MQFISVLITTEIKNNFIVVDAGDLEIGGGDISSGVNEDKKSKFVNKNN